jgi:hypothetical protein
VTVNDTNPIVFYCSQPIHNHCQAGMIGFINSNNETAENDYINMAKGVASNTDPGAVYGGVFVANPASSATVGTTLMGTDESMTMSMSTPMSGSMSMTMSMPMETTTTRAAASSTSSHTSDAAGLRATEKVAAVLGSGFFLWNVAVLL